MKKLIAAAAFAIVALAMFTLALDYATDHSLFGAEIIVPAYFGGTADTQDDPWLLQLEDFMAQYGNPLYYWEVLTQQ